MSYAPDESPADLLLERSNFIGGFLGNMAYGVHGTLYFVCAYLLIRRRRKVQMGFFWLVYITLLFALATIYVACGIKLSEMLWIDDRNYPGGPVQYQNQLFSNYVQLLISSSYNFMTFMADGLLVYRCYLMYSGSGARWIAVLPFLLYLPSTATSIIMLYQASRPQSNVWAQTAANYGIIFWSLSSTLNVLASILIVGRIYFLKKQLNDTLGPDHAKAYTSASAMFLESAALYSITSIIFVGTYARNNWFQNIIVPVLGQITCIAPLLIILRVAYGRAYTFKTMLTSTRIDWGTMSTLDPSSTEDSPNDARRLAPVTIPASGLHLRSNAGSATLADSTKDTTVTFPIPSTIDLEYNQ